MPDPAPPRDTALAVLAELVKWRKRDESYVSDAAFYAEEDAWERARRVLTYHGHAYEDCPRCKRPADTTDSSENTDGD